MTQGDVQQEVVADHGDLRGGIPRRRSIASTAAREGLPTIVGRLPLAFAMAAVTMAPRLRMGPFAPAYAAT